MLICALGVCAAKSAAAQVGTWKAGNFNTGWQGISTLPNATVPGGGEATFVCGPWTETGGTADVDCVINDPGAGGLNSTAWGLYFPTRTRNKGLAGSAGASAAAVALDPTRIYVADTTGNIWYGVPVGKISLQGWPSEPGTYPLEGADEVSPFVWYPLSAYGVQTAVPNCSCVGQTFPASIDSACSFQLADDGNFLYVLGCSAESGAGGYVYYFDWESKSWNTTDPGLTFSSIGYSRYDGHLWGLAANGVPMRLLVGSLTTGGYTYSSYNWSPVNNDLVSNQNVPLSGCNLDYQSTEGTFGAEGFSSTPCIMSIGGAVATTWNLADNDPIMATAGSPGEFGSPTSGELDFFQWGPQGVPRPAAASQFGTNNMTWSKFSLESTSNVPGTFGLGTYGYQESGVLPLFQIAEGGSGVADSGQIDVAWIVTNHGELDMFELPNN